MLLLSECISSHQSTFLVILHYWELRPDFAKRPVESWLRVAAELAQRLCGACGSVARRVSHDGVERRPRPRVLTLLLLYSALKAGNFDRRGFGAPVFPGV